MPPPFVPQAPGSGAASGALGPSVYPDYRRGTLDETITSQIADASMSYYGVSSYDAFNGGVSAKARAVTSLPVPLVYKNFTLVNDLGETSTTTNPDTDTVSFGSASAICYASFNSLIGAGILEEDSYLHTATPHLPANRSLHANGFSRVANLGNYMYTVAAARAVLNCMRDSGTQWLFVDNTEDDILWATNSVQPQEYADQFEWEMRGALWGFRQIFTRLRMQGIKILINGGGALNNVSGGIHTNESLARGDCRPRWYAQIEDLVDGFGYEFPFQGPDADMYDDSIFTGSTDNGAKSWGSYWFRSPGYAQGVANKPHFGIVYGPNAPGPVGTDQAIRYIHAIDLLCWDGVQPGGILVFANTSGANNDTNPTYKWSTGLPLQYMQRTGPATRAFYRYFQKGCLRVNMHFSLDQTIQGVSVPPRDASFLAA